MHKGDIMDLEKIATSAIVMEISKTNILSSFINDGDKEPCWDGNIYIHENAKHTKKNIKRIPTQVKGRAATAKSVKESIKYGVSYDDLNAYMMDGGTIFFVVYIDKEKGEVLQIYYTVLLPIKIKDIFKQKKKTYYVSLKKFPADNKKKIEVVYDAYANAQRQKSFAGTNSPTIEELSKKGVLEGISFHFVHTGEEVVPSMIPKIMEGNSFTIYANVTGNPIGIPVEYCENISQVLTCQQFDRHVTVAGVKYYDKYQNIYSISTVKTVIGNCLTMTYPMIEETEKRKIPVTLEFSINGTLREQIKKIEFVIAIATKGGFEIGDIDIPVSLNREEFREKLNELTERVHWLKSIQDLLNRMHITRDLEINKCTEEDKKNLNLLMTALGEQKPIKDISQDLNILHTLKISNLSLGVIYIKHTDGKYYMYDYFNKHLEAYYKIEGREIRISQFSTMNVKDFTKYDNMYLLIILEDFKQIPISSDILNQANCLMLEMLKAYDQCKLKDLLYTAEQINEWLKQYPDLIEQDICIINGCQITIRQGELNYADKAKLFAISEKSNNMNYRAGAFILLEYMDEAEKIFSSFNDTQMKEFSNYPIYNLYQRYKKKKG